MQLFKHVTLSLCQQQHQDDVRDFDLWVKDMSQDGAK